MNRILGIFVGVLLVALSWLAFRTSFGNWWVGQDDLGFWWAVIATLLGVAALGALVGTWLHTRPRVD